MNQDHLKRLFIEHRQALQAYLTRTLRQPELAADLTQETFLRYAERDVPEEVHNERSYLYRMAHNLAIDHLRQQQRQRTELVPDEQLAEIEDEQPNPEQQVGARSDLARLRAIVAELPLRTRQIFVLNRIEGLTHRQVAERLDVSDSTVQKHLSLALQHVMSRLGSS